ncbi:hypothetical protein BsWGS_24386 [Bradybaena similaris]
MAGFWQQLKALVWRNILLKRRNIGHLLQELLYPVYFIGILAMIRALTKPETKAAMMFPTFSLNDNVFKIPFNENMSVLAVPDTPQVKSSIESVVAQLPGPPRYNLFTTTEAAEAEYAVNHTNIAAGVIFNFDGGPHSYAIRMNYDSVPKTTGYNSNPNECSDAENINGTSDKCTVNTYLTSGFALLQMAVENVLMENLSISSGIRSRKIQVQMMDKGEYSPDTTTIQAISSIYFVFSFSFMANFLAVNIVAEKEKKIKDGMLMMGLRNSVFWLSWGIVYIALITAASLIMIAIIAGSGYFKHSNMFLLFICFILYGSSIITFAFMITPFFNKSRAAGAVTGFSTVIISCIYLAISQTRDAMSYDSNVPVGAQWILCLLSPISFATFVDQALFLDIHMNGFGFGSILTFGKFPLYAPIVMLLVDTVLYAILMVYFDNVIPGEFGVKKHPLYFLQSSYWCPRQVDLESSQLLSPARSLSQTVDVEPVGSDMENKVAMRISSLTKSFKQDDKIQNAVDGFCLDIYEGQITCLLGHNGAGKTTLINMLTGVIPPTSGNAQIMGLDITHSSDLEQIRKRCGICPQHNILYDDLSCREHLEMFANIKGVPSPLINATVEQALVDVDLKSQSETFARNLSGGQKRKLSVAIALIGDPKLIFLDEPTAGMDPFSRRHLWSLLKRMKEGKVVLLTTHFMDEADILADRKAFIRKGKLRCCGSSLFLKNKFGVGYHLTMVVEPNCDVDNVTDLLRTAIPEVEHTRTHGKEISYTVPLQDVSKFSDLFSNLDQVAESHGIKSYGVSMTTLEEVFLKLEADEFEETEDVNNGELNSGFLPDYRSINIDKHGSTTDNESIGKSTVRGSDLTRQRFWALMKVRFLLKLRDKKAVFFQIMLPIAFVIFGLVISKTSEKSSVQTLSPLFFTPTLYARPAGMPGQQPPSFLVFDALNNTGSQAVISNWKRLYAVDTYLAGTKNMSDVAPHYLGVKIESVTGQNLTDFVALYNDSAVHSIPFIINMATQNILNSSKIDAFINGSSLPWPNLSEELSYNAGSMLAAMLVGLAFILIIPGFSAEIVKDRELKLRGQLRISGLTFNLYWGTIYVCDLLVYLIPVVIIIIVVLAVQIQGLNSGGALGALLLLFVTNIPFNIVLALVLSFLFDKSETCSAYLPILLNLISLVPYLAVSLIDMISNSNAAIVIHYLACIIDPPYIVFGGFYFISRVNMVAMTKGRAVSESDYFDFGNHVIICIIMPIIHLFWMYWLLRILDVKKAGGSFLEAFPCFSESTDTSQRVNSDVIDPEDDDVMAERHRIEHLQMGDSRPPVAYMSQLRKLFVKRTNSSGIWKPAKVKVKIAVRNLSIGVDQGEVLGLLGPNGAGKSTALNMMTAETSPTCGKVVVAGHNIRSNMLSVLESLGYCPQHDALWEQITLEEHVKCFAAIKGVHSAELDRVVDYFVDQLKLEKHRKKHAKKLSGGTKRKLSYIISILGSPHFVLLDEPSTGMDPQSKRFLWDTISSSFKGTDRGAILTTHYMEEADALCNRVGIMVNGQLECLGSTQHLKNKYGSGYILEVKLGAHSSGEVEALMDNLEAHLTKLFPGLCKVERFQERAQYSIPKDDVKFLGQTFASLENCKKTHNLEEYSFSQSSLEQVFLHFAKQQVQEGEEAVPGSIKPDTRRINTAGNMTI